MLPYVQCYQRAGWKEGRKDQIRQPVKASSENKGTASQKQPHHRYIPMAASDKIHKQEYKIPADPDGEHGSSPFLSCVIAPIIPYPRAKHNRQAVLKTGHTCTAFMEQRPIIKKRGSAAPSFFCRFIISLLQPRFPPRAIRGTPAGAPGGSGSAYRRAYPCRPDGFSPVSRPRTSS